MTPNYLHSMTFYLTFFPFFIILPITKTVKKVHKLRKLRIDEIVQPQSKVPAISTRTAPNKTKASIIKKQKALLEKYMAKALTKGDKKSTKSDFIKDLIKDSQSQNRLVVDPNGTNKYDLWDINTPSDNASSTVTVLPTPLIPTRSVTTTVITNPKELELLAQLEYVPRPIPPKKPTVDVPVTMKAIPAVRVAHEGNSYNPVFEHHQSALRKALDVEENKLRKQEFLQSKLAYPKELDLLEDDDGFGFFEDEEEQEDEGADDNNNEGVTADGEPTTESSPKKKQPKRKTESQKQKARIQKHLEKEIAHKKQLKKLQNQLKDLPNLLKKLGKQEGKLKQEQNGEEIEQVDMAKVMKRAPRLGPHVYRPNSMEIMLTDELTDSLRRLKPEGNMFKDRFSSLEERGLIETRLPVSKRRRYQLKSFETPSYRFWGKKQ